MAQTSVFLMVANRVERCDDGIESHGTMIDEKVLCSHDLLENTVYIGGSALSLSMGINQLENCSHLYPLRVTP